MKPTFLRLACNDFCDQASIQAHHRYINVDADEGDGVEVKGSKVSFYLAVGALCSAHFPSFSMALFKAHLPFLLIALSLSSL